MTERLYDNDSHLKEFTATVLDSYPKADGFFTVLDRTAFFPEGGGQPSDTGYLDGIRVYDVQTDNGIIYHYTTEQLEIGQQVKGAIDFEKRFRNMQNHSGEHIVSGIVHSMYGLNNIGFHLGTDMTVDFDGELTREQLDEVEALANRAVWENLPVKAYYPRSDRLSEINYRSKKELDGAVRIVEIGEIDICACCAPHVKSTGEIGIIKILDFFKNKGGIRVFIKCGGDALYDYRDKYTSALKISKLLSVKQCETSSATERLFNENRELSAEISQLKKRLTEEKVKGFTARKEITALFEESLDIKELQLFSDALYKKCGGIRAVFSGSEDSYSFAICGEENKLETFFAKFKECFKARGGGRNGMVQGTVAAEKKRLEEFFSLDKA